MYTKLSLVLLFSIYCILNWENIYGGIHSLRCIKMEEKIYKHKTIFCRILEILYIYTKNIQYRAKAHDSIYCIFKP
jgi:hypothetical protein